MNEITEGKREAVTGLPPSPGSAAAGALGCTCPVIDNGHGRGYMGQPGIFVMTENCPLHGRRLETKSQERTE